MTNTEERIENWCIWTSLGVYYVVWVLVPVAFAGKSYWYVGAVLGLVYVGMYVREMIFSHHCGLSVDGTAVPATMVAALLLYFSVREPYAADHQQLMAFLSLGLSLILGHVAAMLYAFCFDQFFTTLLHARIARERARRRRVTLSRPPII